MSSIGIALTVALLEGDDARDLAVIKEVAANRNGFHVGLVFAHPACGRQYGLTSKGVVRVHFDGREARWGKNPCPGSGVKPRGSVK